LGLGRKSRLFDFGAGWLDFFSTFRLARLFLSEKGVCDLTVAAAEVEKAKRRKVEKSRERARPRGFALGLGRKSRLFDFSTGVPFFEEGGSQSLTVARALAPKVEKSKKLQARAAKGFALDFSTFRARDFSTGGRATLAWPLFFLGGRGSVRSTLSCIFSFISFFSCLSLCGLEQSHTSSSTPLPGRVRVLDRPPHRHRRQRGRPPASQLDPIRDPPKIPQKIRDPHHQPFFSPFSRPHFSAPFFACMK